MFSHQYILALQLRLQILQLNALSVVKSELPLIHANIRNGRIIIYNVKNNGN